MALPHGRKSVDNAGARHGTDRKDDDVRARHVLFLRRAELAQGRQGVPPRLQQARGQADHPAGHAQPDVNQIHDYEYK